jgi:hypothetical protein
VGVETEVEPVYSLENDIRQSPLSKIKKRNLEKQDAVTKSQVEQNDYSGDEGC